MNEGMFYRLLGSGGMTTGLSYQVASEIGRRIVSGVYPCGELVDDEDDMAKHFHVSRTVVREAMKIICAKGLLDIRRGVGARVNDRSHWRLLDDDVLAWHQWSPAPVKTLGQLMELRLSLEPSAAAWAAQRADDSDLSAIADSIRRMNETCENAETYVAADAAFHRAVLYAAHNEFVLKLEGVIYTALLTSIRLTNQTPQENLESVALHEAVADAIGGGKPDAARKRMRVLLADAAARLSARVPDYPSLAGNAADKGMH